MNETRHHPLRPDVQPPTKNSRHPAYIPDSPCDKFAINRRLRRALALDKDYSSFRWVHLYERIRREIAPLLMNNIWNKIASFAEDIWIEIACFVEGIWKKIGCFVWLFIGALPGYFLMRGEYEKTFATILAYAVIIIIRKVFADFFAFAFEVLGNR